MTERCPVCLCEPNDKQSNIAFLTHFMNFSDAGPLAQVMVLTAIEAYAREIVQLDEPPENWNGMVSFAAWRRACEEFLEQIENR